MGAKDSRRGCNETTGRRDDEATRRRGDEATRRRQDSPPDARRRPAGLRQRERNEGGSRCQLDVATRPRRRGGKSRSGTCDSEAPHAPQAWPKACRRVKARRSAHASTSLFQNCDVPILMEVTRCPHALSSTPTLLAVTPLPRPETTPPVTSTYFMVLQEFENQVARGMPWAYMVRFDALRRSPTKYKLPVTSTWSLFPAPNDFALLRTRRSVSARDGETTDLGRRCCPL